MKTQVIEMKATCTTHDNLCHDASHSNNSYLVLFVIGLLLAAIVAAIGKTLAD